MLLTLDKLKNVGAISVEYELQDYHGTNRVIRSSSTRKHSPCSSY